VEEIRQYTVTEYRKSCNYVKNLTKEYQPRNLNVLDVTGQLLSENKKVTDRWKEYFHGKISHQGQ
jgi:chemotaxis regulatin CheY-phosphate phosphatase CheZ